MKTVFKLPKLMFWFKQWPVYRILTISVYRFPARMQNISNVQFLIETSYFYMITLNLIQRILCCHCLLVKAPHIPLTCTEQCTWRSSAFTVTSHGTEWSLRVAWTPGDVYWWYNGWNWGNSVFLFDPVMLWSMKVGISAACAPKKVALPPTTEARVEKVKRAHPCKHVRGSMRLTLNLWI